MALTNEHLEALAFGDRAAAIETLVPGSPDRMYVEILGAIDAGDFAHAGALLETWRVAARNTREPRIDTLRARLALRRLAANPHDDEARRAVMVLGNLEHLPAEPAPEGAPTDSETAELAPVRERFPTRLDSSALTAATVIERAIAVRNDLGALTDAALLEAMPFVAERPLGDPSRLHLLNRLGPALAYPAAAALYAAELARAETPKSLLNHLTHSQLSDIAKLHPSITGESEWVEAMLRRLAPPPDQDIVRDAVARDLLLDRLESFTSNLPPAFHMLRAAVLRTRLAALMASVHLDPTTLDDARADALMAYLLALVALPWRGAWAGDRDLRQQPTAHPRTPSLTLVGLTPPAGDAEATVDECLRLLLSHRPNTSLAPLERWLWSAWLAELRATVDLLRSNDPVRQADAARLLGPDRTNALRDRVQLDFAGPAVRHFAPDDAVVLPVVVKNVPELAVRIFRIDPVARYLAGEAPIDLGVDLDGIGPTDSFTRTFDTPPQRQHDVALALPMCVGPGVWVVELIGGGRASRAIIRKGALYATTRVGAAGVVVTVVDGDGTPLSDVSVWVENRRFDVPAGRTSVVVPFGASARNVRALAVDHTRGDLATAFDLTIPAETFDLKATAFVDRAQWTSGETLRAVIQTVLRVAGQPASLQLLESVHVTVHVVDAAGRATTRREPLTLSDERDAVLTLRVPEQPRTIELTLGARMRNARGEYVELTHRFSTTTGAMRDEALHRACFLRRTSAGHRLEVLGLGGEPVPRVDVTVAVESRLVCDPLQFHLSTDEAGGIDLGPLEGAVTAITARLDGVSQRFELVPSALLEGSRNPPLHVAADTAFTLRIPPDARGPVLLVSLRGDAPERDLSEHVELQSHALRVGALPPGDYRVFLNGSAWRTLRVAKVGPGGLAQRPNLLLQPSELPPFAADARIDAATGDLVAIIHGATETTRVHLIATPYLPDPAFGPVAPSSHQPRSFGAAPPATEMVSGRTLGDEYRYVLDRRNYPRRLGNLLPRPGLLLNPWAVRTTTNRRQEAREGTNWPAPPPPPAPAAMPSMAASAGMAYCMGVTTGTHAFAKADDPNRSGHAAWDYLQLVPRVIDHIPLTANASGAALRIPAAMFAGLGHLRMIVADTVGSHTVDVTTGATPATPRDLRPVPTFAADAPVRQLRGVRAGFAGQTITIADTRTGRVELVDHTARAHRTVAALGLESGADTFETFAFLATWNTLDDDARRDLYSRHACHELHLFLRFRDPAFFAAVVAPHLAQKFQKTFIDLWLLDANLDAWRAPEAIARLNTIECLLLARRFPDLAPAVARACADAVVAQGPTHARDARLVATLLGIAALDAPPPEPEPFAEAFSAGAAMDAMPEEEEAPAPRRKRSARPSGGGRGGDLESDATARTAAEPVFRAPETTREWAENNWWHRLDATGPHMAPNRFWSDYARHLATSPDAPFVSPHLADITGSFTEAICALALLDLPWNPPAHTTTREGLGFSLTLAAPAIAAEVDIGPADGTPTGDVLVGQSFIARDDPTVRVDGQLRDRTTEGPFTPGAPYLMRVVVSNPTARERNVEVLMQIPRGALPLGATAPTRTEHLHLKRYATEVIDTPFYFPAAGHFAHGTTLVFEGQAWVGAARPIGGDGQLEASFAEPAAHARGWDYIAERGTDDEVLDYLDKHAADAPDLGQLQLRLSRPAFYRRLVAFFEARHSFIPEVWAFAFVHRDGPRMAAWLRAHPTILGRAGPVLAGGPFAWDTATPRDRALFQHLEYAPLVPSRAHRLGDQQAVTNDGLATTWRAFLEYAMHLGTPRPDELLAFCHYQLALDRVDDARVTLNRIDRAAVSTPMAFDYAAAWLAISAGDLPRALQLATPWQQHPADHWRRLFAAVLAVGSDEGATSDAPDTREAALQQLTAKTPTLALTVKDQQMILEHQHLTTVVLRFHPVDLELLFSRAPFVETDAARFGWVAPALTQVVTPRETATTHMPIPAAFSGANVVITASGGDVRCAVTHLASDLQVVVSERAGRLTVSRRSTGARATAAYVKVYGRDSNGKAFFYKDGYTDLAGRFDYASVSTDDLGRTKRFAVLVVDAEGGAARLECAPPLAGG